MPQELTQAALAILFASLAGGVTNAVAVWMLFHPYEPPRLFGRQLRFLQGAIPKNKARLAAAIGRTVGTRLLTPEDLARTVSEPVFRDAFDERLRRFLAAALERERGPLAETLPPALARELRALLADAANASLARFEAYLETEEFRAAVGRWTERLARELQDQPIREYLTAEREAALTRAAERWITEATESKAFEQAVHDYLDRAADRILLPDRTFQDLLPAGLVAAVERAIASYLPLAIERLATLLEDPAARSAIERVLHEILQRFMQDLKFHQRLVAALLITPETIDRVLRTIETEGATSIAQLLHDPAVRDAMWRHVNAAIVDFLRRPVVSVLGRPGEPSFDAARATIAGWILSLARAPQTRAFLVDKLKMALAAEHRTWADLFRLLPPDRLADAIVAAARSQQARAIYRDALNRIAALALERPLGRPADYLPADAATRLEHALADPLWGWIQEQVPALAQRVDVSRRVEEKILEFPMERVEELIRSVSERELRLIIRLGYLLGALIGIISATLNLLL
jgi:uncharacterized membrane protein YheB (UPF0754 family)